MGIFIGIVICFIAIYGFNRFDISHKKFLIGLVGLLLITRGISVLEIHNPQMSDFNIMYEISEDLTDGNLEESSKEYISSSQFCIPFVIFQAIILKVANKMVILKLINVVLSIFSILILYRIMNRIAGKKAAQIFTTLYSVFINTILYNSILSSQHIFLFLTLLSFELVFEDNIIKNKFIKIGIISIIMAIANLLRPEAIIFVISYILFLILKLFLKKENIKDCIIKVLIFIIGYSLITAVVLIVLNQMGMIQNFKESIGACLFQPICTDAENEKSILEKSNIFWNGFSNEASLGYLHENGINILGIKSSIDYAYDFTYLYDCVVWIVGCILAIIGIFYIKNKEEKFIYYIYTLIAFLTYMFVDVKGCYAFTYRPYIFILAAVGLSNISTFFEKEKVKKCFEKIGEICNKLVKNNIFKIAILILLSMHLTYISLKLSVGELGEIMFNSYFENIWILLLNFLPIVFIAVAVYIVTNRVSIAYAISAFISYAVTVVNYVKMGIRNDNFLFEDIFLIKEAATTKIDYQIILDIEIIKYIVFFVMLSTILYVFIDKNRKKSNCTITKKILTKLVLSICLVIVGFIGINKIYIAENFYEKTRNDKNFKDAMWTDRNKYISRGCIYSFLHSYSNIKQVPPEGYNEKEAKNILLSYEYSDIEEEKKVNIISIMLESYNDLSKFEEIEFVKDPYEKFHEIQESSYSGELVTSIFGGGTIDTERKFLTGYSKLLNFRRKTNSYVYYLKEQGYTVEGSHPAEEWFYSRSLINANMGFENYYFNENKYSLLSGDLHAPDSVLMDEILNLYNNHKENNNNPYFSFSVTYQNHLPYNSTSLRGEEYVEKTEEFSDEEYYILNNYLEGINNTGEQLHNMIQKLENYEEPTVLILFGDHNPSLGDVYNKLGIDFDLSTEQGVYNYYCTPYVIWANSSAKEILNNNFVGNGEKISPNFLMNKFFELAGYQGNEFAKVSNEIMKNISVTGEDFYIENGEYVRSLSEENQKRINEFYKIQYYWANEYREK